MSATITAEKQSTSVGSTDKSLEMKGLSIGFGPSTVVSNVDLVVERNEIVGLIGESGCGKSSVALAAMGILDSKAHIAAERLHVAGVDLLKSTPKELAAMRGNRVSMIFQEPMTALNPTMRIGHQISEVFRIHERLRKSEAMDKAIALLSQVNIPSPEMRAQQYPHEMSGGMRQRVVIAMAMAGQPDLLVADEPTTALDVTVQAEVLDLLRSLQSKTQMGVLLISHDLGVVSSLCTKIKVMYAGEIVESGTTREVLQRPRHPYTKALLEALPRVSTSGDRIPLPAIKGQLTEEARKTSGCRFRFRCPSAEQQCEAPQPLRDLDNGRSTRCWQDLPLVNVEG